MGYKALTPEDLVISTDSVTATVWSNNTPTLQTFHTSSAQTSSNAGKYYWDVYQSSSTAAGAAKEALRMTARHH